MLSCGKILSTVDDAIDPFEFQDGKSYIHKEAHFETVLADDGVDYPGISFDVPVHWQLEMRRHVAEITGEDVVERYGFMRVTTPFLPRAPHQAHNDAAFGRFAAFLYINPAPEHVHLPGTEFVQHKYCGMVSGPKSEEQQLLWQRDCNNWAQWECYKRIEWKPNRLVVFDAELMHRSSPPTGWGNDVRDGRLLMICFYA